MTDIPTIELRRLAIDLALLLYGSDFEDGAPRFAEFLEAGGDEWALRKAAETPLWGKSPEKVVALAQRFQAFARPPC